MRQIKEYSGDAIEFDAAQPLVLPGIASAWPAVAIGASGPQAMADYLRQFDRGVAFDVMEGPPEIKGRFFYTNDLRGLNFRRHKVLLEPLLAELLSSVSRPHPHTIYAGAAATDVHLPGFAEANCLSIATPGAEPRIWVGNATKVSTHFDASHNIAVVVQGTRRFTLFPPQQTGNLYLGPLNFTLAGQPVSLPDVRTPDFEKFPRFEEALENALVADLSPGDAIFIPALWWHDVEATAPFNVLMNYWHGQAQEVAAFDAFVHAMLAIRDLPAPEREGWKAWFDHFIFSDNPADAAAHMPEESRGIQGSSSPGRSQAIRQYLLRALSM